MLNNILRLVNFKYTIEIIPTRPLSASVKDLALPGVKLADLARFPDERGIFTEICGLTGKSCWVRTALFRQTYL